MEIQDPHDEYLEDELENKFIVDLGWDLASASLSWVNIKMPWNTIRSHPWKRLGKLGKGAFARVYLGETIEDQRVFAVKSIKFPPKDQSENPDQDVFKAQMNEIKMLKKLRECKYVISFLGCGRSQIKKGTQINETLDVFMELSVKGDLLKVRDAHCGRNNELPKFEEDPYIKQYAYDLLQALVYMEIQKVVHGDIKLNNILLMENCLKLSDWGGSKEMNTSMDINELITFTYCAPEVIDDNESSYSADVFALGCAVIEMATGKAPYNEHYKKGRKLKQIFTYTDARFKLSTDLLNFLSCCLCKKPSDRWTAAELLHHPFITKRDKTNNLPYEISVKLKESDLHKRLLVPLHTNCAQVANPEPTQRVLKYLHPHSSSKSSWSPSACCGGNDPDPHLPESCQRLRVPGPEHASRHDGSEHESSVHTPMPQTEDLNLLSSDNSIRRVSSPTPGPLGKRRCQQKGPQGSCTGEDAVDVAEPSSSPRKQMQ